MKKLLALIITVLSTSAFAGFEGSVGYTSDYIWRGASQTGGEGALQAGVSFDGKGFYAGAWASEVDFGDDASIEYDFYGGYKLEMSDKVSVDVGVLQYNWNDSAYESVEEVYLAADVGFLSLGYNMDMDNSDKTYITAGIRFPFVEFADVSLHHGEFDTGDSVQSLNISKTLGKWNLSALVLDGVRHGDAMDSVSLSVDYRLF